MATPVIQVFVLPFYLTTELKHATENRHNPTVGLTVIILIFLHMESAWRAAHLRLATASSSISSTPQPMLLPSPYFASSAYSYPYAYSNTPGRPALNKGAIVFVSISKK